MGGDAVAQFLRLVPCPLTLMKMLRLYSVDSSAGSASNQLCDLG